MVSASLEIQLSWDAGHPIIEKPSSLEASFPVSPRKPRNVAQKCVVKKLKLLEATRLGVSSTTRVVEYYR
jgi:hypothetical protein